MKMPISQVAYFEIGEGLCVVQATLEDRGSVVYHKGPKAGTSLANPKFRWAAHYFDESQAIALVEKIEVSGEIDTQYWWSNRPLHEDNDPEMWEYLDSKREDAFVNDGSH